MEQGYIGANGIRLYVASRHKKCPNIVVGQNCCPSESVKSFSLSSAANLRQSFESAKYFSPFSLADKELCYFVIPQKAVRYRITKIILK